MPIFKGITEIIVKFKTLYGYGGCCLKIIDVCMDFEPCFKVHNFVCGHPSLVTQGQLVEAKQSKPGRNRRGESDSEVTVRRLGKIIQSILFAHSGASICRVAWKWSGETRFPGALVLL